MRDIERAVPVEGVNVVYRDSGREDGVPLVFIHGMACDSTFWRYQFPAFEADYRVLAPDLPGYGRSDKPHDREYTMDFFARAVRAVVESTGSGRAPVLIGHSMGYPILRRYLLLYPGCAGAIVNVDGFYFRRAVQAEAYQVWAAAAKALLWRGSGRDPAAAGRRFIEYTFYDHTPEHVREEVRAKTGQADPYVVSSSWREMMRPSKWVKCCFMVPALVLYSRARHTLPDQPLYFRSCYPRMTYVEWDDTGHYPMLEQPERFNAQLRAFLDETEIGG